MQLAALLAAVVLLAPFGVSPDAPDGGRPPPGLLFDDPALRALTPTELEALGPLPLPLGDRAVYGVSYYGIPIGHGVLEVARVVGDGERSFVHLVATARTNEFFSRFYRVDDRHEALVDVETARIDRTRTRTLHGDNESHESVRFDWATHYVFEREVEFQKGREFQTEFDFGPFVYDIFDAWYALRATPGAPGFEVTIPVYASVKVRAVRFSVGERSTLANPAVGEVEVVEVRPREVDGVREDAGAGGGRVYALAGDDHLPVLLSGWFRASERLRVGGMTAELLSWRRSRSAWPVPAEGAFTPPPVVEIDDDGRPRWVPPAELAAARAKAGVVARDDEYPFPR